MKRLIACIFLAVTLCFCLASCGSDFEGFTGNVDITCKIEGSEAVVTKVPDKSIVTHIVIPDEYEGVPVTYVEKFSATNLKYVTKVTIGKNVKDISDWAFGNSRMIAEFEVDEENEYLCDVDGVLFTRDMKTLLFYPPAKDNAQAKGDEQVENSYVIPEGVETIRSKAFYKCYEMTEITLPSTLIAIEEKVFFRCSLKAIELPDGLEHIGKDAFSFNPLETITIPSSVKQIDDYAFFQCASLKEVNMKGRESDMILGKKWYPTIDTMQNSDIAVINWQVK